jgi:hypothetical protein
VMQEKYFNVEKSVLTLSVTNTRILALTQPGNIVFMNTDFPGLVPYFVLYDFSEPSSFSETITTAKFVYHRSNIPSCPDLLLLGLSNGLIKVVEVGRGLVQGQADNFLRRLEIDPLLPLASSQDNDDASVFAVAVLWRLWQDIAGPTDYASGRTSVSSGQALEEGVMEWRHLEEPSTSVWEAKLDQVAALRQRAKRFFSSAPDMLERWIERAISIEQWIASVQTQYEGKGLLVSEVQRHLRRCIELLDFRPGPKATTQKDPQKENENDKVRPLLRPRDPTLVEAALHPSLHQTRRRLETLRKNLQRCLRRLLREGLGSVLRAAESALQWVACLLNSGKNECSQDTVDLAKKKLRALQHTNLCPQDLYEELIKDELQLIQEATVQLRKFVEQHKVSQAEELLVLSCTKTTRFERQQQIKAITEFLQDEDTREWLPEAKRVEVECELASLQKAEETKRSEKLETDLIAEVCDLAAVVEGWREMSGLAVTQARQRLQELQHALKTMSSLDQSTRSTLQQSLEDQETKLSLRAAQLPLDTEWAEIGSLLEPGQQALKAQVEMKEIGDIREALSGVQQALQARSGGGSSSPTLAQLAEEVEKRKRQLELYNGHEWYLIVAKQIADLEKQIRQFSLGPVEDDTDEPYLSDADIEASSSSSTLVWHLREASSSSILDK